MQHVCLLRLGHSLRQLPTRHYPRGRQLLLPRTIDRANHGFAQGDGHLTGENHERQGQSGARRALTATDAPPSTTRVAAAQSDSKLTSRRASSSNLTGAAGDRRGKSKLKRDLSRSLQDPHSTFSPLDERARFIKELDNLEDESEKLAKILLGFTRNEADQRARLNLPHEHSIISRFSAWKAALKDFRPESKEIKPPTSIAERKQTQRIAMCTSVEDVMAIWPSIPDGMRHIHKEVSRTLLLGAVRYVPDKLHLVFEAALSLPNARPPWYVIEDVIELLAMRLRAIGLEKVRAIAAHNLADKVVQVLSSQRMEGRVQFSQVTIYSILAHLPPADIEPWYRELCAWQCPLHPYTELQFASRLAQSPSNKTMSAHVLQRLHETKLLDINSPMAASVVTTILSFSKKELASMDEASITPADLFRLLHSIGLVPNVITYTAIIRGLCLKKDLGTALDVFDVMQQHGVQANEWTYSILLHGCKEQSDWPALAEIGIKACQANIRDNVVWSQVLYATYICILREHKDIRGPRRSVLFAMNTIYQRIFDAQFIRPFITGRLTEMGELAGQQKWFPKPLARLQTEIVSLPPLELLKPNADTIAIMLLGLIRILPMPYDVVVFYSQYRHMLKQGHPVAQLMVQEKGTFVHDIVLRNLVKWPSTLRVALDIIRDMMGGSIDAATSTDTAGTGAARSLEEMQESKVEAATEEQTATIETPTTNKQSVTGEDLHQQRIRHPRPSVHTWTILVHGFMRAKQPKDAEYIMTLMRANGVEPNVVTWNTLAAGYAKLQMIPEAVKAMRRLERAGHEADDWTLRAFQYIGNKAKAVELMEATVERNKAHKMAEEQQQQEQQQHQREDVDAKQEAEVLHLDTERAVEAEADGVVAEQPLQDEEPMQQQQWPHGNDEVHQDQDEDEAYLDSLIEEPFEQLDHQNIQHLQPPIMSAHASKAIYNRMVASLEAAGSPVTEKDRLDIESWLQIRSRGLQAVPQTPPQRVVGLQPAQAELRKQLGPWTMYSEPELDAMGVRVKPDPEQGEKYLEGRPPGPVKALPKSRRFPAKNE